MKDWQKTILGVAAAAIIGLLVTDILRQEKLAAEMAQATKSMDQLIAMALQANKDIGVLKAQVDTNTRDIDRLREYHRAHPVPK